MVEALLHVFTVDVEGDDYQGAEELVKEHRCERRMNLWTGVP